MNREHIDKAIDLLQAIKDGAVIECKGKDGIWFRSFANDSISELSPDLEYRAVYPKLTAEVFNREDCPKRAKFAVVNANGNGFFTIDRPYISNDEFATLSDFKNDYKYIGKFDATDWQNSLIERKSDVHYEDYVFGCGNSRGAAVTTRDKDDVTCKNCLELLKNKLPEWCKVGAMVFYGDKVVCILGINDDLIEISSNNVVNLSVSIGFLSPATYVLPTIDEIFQSTSLALKSRRLDYFSTIVKSDTSGKIYVSSDNEPMNLSYLDAQFTWADGTSIGKWVKVAE